MSEFQIKPMVMTILHILFYMNFLKQILQFQALVFKRVNEENYRTLYLKN